VTTANHALFHIGARRNLPMGGPKHKRSQGGVKGSMPPKCLEHIVILCFERRFSKQNSVIRLKLNILVYYTLPNIVYTFFNF